MATWVCLRNCLDIPADKTDITELSEGKEDGVTTLRKTQVGMQTFSSY